MKDIIISFRPSDLVKKVLDHKKNRSQYINDAISFYFYHTNSQSDRLLSDIQEMIKRFDKLIEEVGDK